MRRRLLIVTGIVIVIMAAIIAAIPVAAHMGEHADRPGVSQANATSVSTSSSSQVTPVTISLAQARTNFTQFLSRLGYHERTISEVMQFSNQFYAEAVESNSGAGAFEMVMNLDGSNVYPEPGPTMMWNTAYSPMLGTAGAAMGDYMWGSGAHSGTGNGYGMMSGDGYGMMGSCDDESDHANSANGHGYGMMGGSGGWTGATGAPSSAARYGWCEGDAHMGYHPETATQLATQLTADTAQTRVQSWLDQNRPGVTASDATAFPGYFTFHTEQNGKIIGMLSIQSSTGAIWEHVWHGTFVDMQTTP